MEPAFLWHTAGGRERSQPRAGYSSNSISAFSGMRTLLTFRESNETDKIMKAFFKSFIPFPTKVIHTRKREGIISQFIEHLREVIQPKSYTIELRFTNLGGHKDGTVAETFKKCRWE